MARGGVDVGRRLDQHGDVEMVLEQLGGFDRALVAAVDQRDALAREADERNVGHRLGGGRQQRRHLRPGRGRIARPARGLADVGVGDRRSLPLLRRPRRTAALPACSRRSAARRRPRLRGTVRARPGRGGAPVVTLAPRQPRRSRRHRAASCLRTSRSRYSRIVGHFVRIHRVMPARGHPSAHRQMVIAERHPPSDYNVVLNDKSRQSREALVPVRDAKRECAAPRRRRRRSTCRRRSGW